MMEVSIAQEDTYLWLEEVDGAEALEFVEAQTKRTDEVFTSSEHYEDIYNKCLNIYDSSDRIAYPTVRGEFIYNFWKDESNVRGIWRRCSKSSYVKGNPEWETLLDIDALSEEDDEKWVFKGANGLYPSYDRFLIQLSKGGGDAVVIKEYDMTKRTFIDEGFTVLEAKGSAEYIDQNTLMISSDFGEGTMTDSGYPNQVKIWNRGTALEEAELIHEGEKTDVGSWGYISRDNDKNYKCIYRSKTFYSRVMKVWYKGQFRSLDLPEDARFSELINDNAIIELKSDWEINNDSYAQGSVLSLDFPALLDGHHKIELIYQPDEYVSVESISATNNTLLINILKDVISELYIYRHDGKQWSKDKVDAPGLGTLSIIATDEFSDDYFFQYQNLISPKTLYYGNSKDNTFEAFKSLTSYFNTEAYELKQYKVASKDGTMVPYFVVAPKDMKYDGSHPTLLEAYGGFEVSMLPYYSGTVGVSWLEKGGIYVLANIRGGGEYGPKWHQAGLKEKRQNVYDDFHAIAEDLIERKITSAEHLGITGGSNGGLLVGVAFTQRPDLYNAVMCLVPLLDMKRYNKLLAGASWMGEYGDPDIPEEWDFIKEYSPYHNLKEDSVYPEVFFYTSTRDDRVHPGHARKMAAKMIDMGHPIYYYENMEGGHAGASTNKQSAKSAALKFSYMLMKLK